MKKILIAIMLILTTILTTTNLSYATSISQSDDTIYISNQLPDIIKFETFNRMHVVYDVEKTFTRNTMYNTTEIDNNGVIYNMQQDSWYPAPNDTNEMTIYSVDSNIMTMIWNDMYIFVDEFNLYMEASDDYTADIEIIYYNSTGDLNNTYKYMDSTQGAWLLSNSMFDGIYEHNGIAHINSIIVHLETIEENMPIGYLTFELDQIHIYETYNDDIQFMAKEFMPNLEFNMGQWLLDSISAFMSFELLPGFSLLTLFSLIVAIPLLLWILKMFVGG